MSIVKRFDIDVNDLSDGDLILKFLEFASCCEVHPAFKDGAPPCVPGPAHYRELADNLRLVLLGATGDKQKEAEVLAIRETGVCFMTFSTQYIVMFSHHHSDTTMLDHLGVALKSRSYKKATHKVLPSRPVNFTVKDDRESGTVSVTVGNWNRRGSVEFQVTEGSPTDEASYRRVGNFYLSRFKAKGLDSVKMYHCRCRFENAAGPGPWSEIVTVVVS